MANSVNHKMTREEFIEKSKRNGCSSKEIKEFLDWRDESATWQKGCAPLDYEFFIAIQEMSKNDY